MRIHIKDYKYKPEKFNYLGGDPAEQVMLGIKLEVDRPLESSPVSEREHDEAAGEVLRMLNKEEEYVYVKKAENPWDGFEIVTHPATLAYHRSRHWEHVLSYLYRRGYRSHATDRCNLYIYVNKSFLGQTEKEILSSESKLLLFFETHWNRLVRLARRIYEEEIYEYCSRYWITNIRSALRRNRKYEYFALNFCHSDDAIKIRLFRGTLSHKIFIATLTLIARIAEFCKKSSRRAVRDWERFKSFLSDEDKELVEYMKEKGVW
jgi:hypothetical protein